MFLDWDVLNASVQALGWALIHFVWQGALVGAVFALAMLVLKKVRPAVRYGVGLCCMAVLATLPVTTFLMVYEGVVPADGGTVAAAMSAFPVGATALVESSGPHWATLLERALPWIVVAWAIGVLLHSLRVFVNWRRMRRLTRVGVREPSPEILRKVEALRQIFGIRRFIRVLESTMIEVPTVLGWLKPVILLPTSSLIGLSPHQLELVIAHELGHVRRLDYIVNLLQVCVETALFYHPVVGWISRRVREEREKCCDDLVVEHCGNRLEYAKALTNLESIRQGDLSPALAATDGQLFQRIERIVHNHSAEPREAVAGNTLFLVIIGAVAVAAGNIGDPMGALELKRDRLADSLVNELLVKAVPAHSESLLAPLESARLALYGTDDAPLQQAEVAPSRATPAARESVGTERGASAGAAAKEAGAEPDSASQATTVANRGVAEREFEPLPIQPADHTISRPRLTQAQPQIERPELTVARTPTVSPAEQAALQTAPTYEPQPLAVRQVQPDYPIRARLAGQQGYVELAFEVSATGRPLDIEIVDSRPRRVFDKAALRALRQWRFDPSSVSGLDVHRFTQRFDFSLSTTGEASRNGGECLTGTRICRSED